MVIAVCIGSGCHVKGSRQIIEILQELIATTPKEIQVELEACFCLGRCTEGVVVKFDNQIVTGVSVENIREIFEEKVAGVKK